MKERYFTPETITRVSEMMVAELEELVRRRRTRLDERRIALLVLDMQRYFLQMDSHAFVPSAPAILPCIRRLVVAFERLDLPVVFTRHINNPENAGQMGEWWRETIQDENPLSQITPELDPGEHKLFLKAQYDAFLNTGLENWLRQRDVRQVVVSGVMTHLCCETTARAAFMRGFQVFFLVDGTATYNMAFHRASLRNLAHGFAELRLVEDVLGELWKA